MAIHSKILAWKIPWTEKPSRLQSIGLQRVGRDWACTQYLKKLIHAEQKLAIEGDFPESDKRIFKTKQIILSSENVENFLIQICLQ